MKVLLLGGSGMLGSDLVRLAPAECVIIAPSRRELDITNPEAVVAALDGLGPDVVINSAAYTDVETAESASDVALAVNAVAVDNLGRAAAQRHIRIVHFSTDYVFNGELSRPYHEDDE